MASIPATSESMATYRQGMGNHDDFPVTPIKEMLKCFMYGNIIAHPCYIQFGQFKDAQTCTTVLSSSKPNRYSSGVEFKNDFASVTMFLEASLVNQHSFVIRAISVAIEFNRCGCSMKLGPLLHTASQS